MHYKGNFWLVAESVRDIRTGNFVCVGQRVPCDDDGNVVGTSEHIRLQPHKVLYNHMANSDGQILKSVDYYPKASVTVYNDHAFIRLPAKLNVMPVIEKIIQCYELDGLITVRDIDTEYGHYKLR